MVLSRGWIGNPSIPTPAATRARMSRSKNVATRAGYLLVKTANLTRFPSRDAGQQGRCTEASSQCPSRTRAGELCRLMHCGVYACGRLPGPSTTLMWQARYSRAGIPIRGAEYVVGDAQLRALFGRGSQLRPCDVDLRHRAERGHVPNCRTHAAQSKIGRASCRERV